MLQSAWQVSASRGLPTLLAFENPDVALGISVFSICSLPFLSSPDAQALKISSVAFLFYGSQIEFFLLSI